MSTAGPPAADAVRGTTGAHYEQQLSRSLSLRGNILITLSSVTPASSVFIILPSVIVAVAGASFVALAVAGVVGVAMAFCYAELSSAFPIAGGEYAFAARVLGKGTGFALFLMNALSIILIVAVVALGTGQYLSALWAGFDSSWAGVVVIVLSALVAILNIRLNAWVTGTFLAVEMLALLVLTALGVLHVSRPLSTLFVPQSLDGGALAAASWGLVAAQTATALFAYNGYGAAVYFAEETRGASRGIAKVILVSLGITVAAELIPTTAVVLGAPSLKDLVASAAPMQYFVTARGGSALNTVVSVGIALAIINAVVAITLQAGRTVYGSARDRAYPDAVSDLLARVHPRWHTPVAATLLVGLAAAVVAAAVPLGALITATGATVVVLYALVALSALVGRRNGTTAGAAYRMPAWPLAPLVVIAALVYVAYQLWVADPVQLEIAVGALLLGYAYWAAYLRPRSAERWTMPDAPLEELEELEARDELARPGGLLMGPALEVEPPGVPDEPAGPAGPRR